MVVKQREIAITTGFLQTQQGFYKHRELQLQGCVSMSGIRRAVNQRGFYKHGGLQMTWNHSHRVFTNAGLTGIRSDKHSLAGDGLVNDLDKDIGMRISKCHTHKYRVFVKIRVSYNCCIDIIRSQFHFLVEKLTEGYYTLSVSVLTT